MFIRKLVYSNLTVRKSRAALTIAAVALSVSLVVAVTSGYASLFEAAYGYLVQYMGTTDAKINRKDQPTGLPAEIVDQLRNDPAVSHVDPRLTAPSYFLNPDAPVKKEDEGKLKEASKMRAELIGVERPDDHRVDRLKLEAGKWFDSSTGDVCVVDQGVASILKIWVGDNVALPYLADKRITLKVVGIAHKPALISVYHHTIYMPMHTLQKLVNAEGRYSNAMIDLKDNVDQKAFEQRWLPKFNSYLPPIRIQLTNEVRSKMDENLQGIHLLSYLGSAVSMLSATFIIFSALSMGVSERQRSLAMLRAVGAFKSQIAGLVIFEGLVLGITGIIIGVPLGYAFIKVLSLIFNEVFSSGAVISWGGVLFGAGGTLFTALLASLLPAWNATRVNPLEAMSPLTNASRGRAPITSAIIGALLIGVDPFFFFGPINWFAQKMHSRQPEQMARSLKFYCHFAFGLPAMFVGLFLIAPMCVWLTEKIMGPIVAKMFGLQFSLIRQQLTNGIWRAAGTASALMVGLAVLIVMQVTGRTVLNGWQLPDKFPDVFIGAPAGLSSTDVQELKRVTGLKEIMPVEISSVQLGGMGGNPFAVGFAMISPLSQSQQGSKLVPDSTMFIGVDPDKVFEMMELDFKLGNKEDAKRYLKEGGWVVVTEEYRMLTHCQIGDPIKLGKEQFRIAAVVWSPGIDVMKGMYDLADQFDERTISSVFGSLSDGQKYFGAQPYAFCGEITPGLPRAELIKQIKTEVHGMNLEVADVREIKAKIETGFTRLLNMLSTVAFAAMAVASLGVTNTIMAGVRTRRWQFGILRSIGVTRGQLLRLVMAEALVLGFIGCFLGLGAGSLMSVNANALMRIVTGYHPSLLIPWVVIAIGIGSVLFISLAASIWPAVTVARTEPLSLLQAGRAAT